MVQVVENRADLEGQLVAIRDDAIRPGHKVATVDVHSAQEVQPYPNLMKSAPGTQIDVVVPAEYSSRLQAGDRVRLRVRRAGPTTVLAESCMPAS